MSEKPALREMFSFEARPLKVISDLTNPNRTAVAFSGSDQLSYVDMTITVPTPPAPQPFPFTPEALTREKKDPGDPYTVRQPRRFIVRVYEVVDGGD